MERSRPKRLASGPCAAILRKKIPKRNGCMPRSFRRRTPRSHEAIDHRGGSRNRLDGQAAESTGAVSDAALHSYMDGLFGDIMNACHQRTAGASTPRRVSRACVPVDRAGPPGGFPGRAPGIRGEDPLRKLDRSADGRIRRAEFGHTQISRASSLPTSRADRVLCSRCRFDK